ncbi:MAG TPA: beta-ketoacyl-ACP synthase II [Actinomycetales bacterium]|nr:beta-ketoacyl-ACP synthase II [Actinomycetales bacterium]
MSGQRTVVVTGIGATTPLGGDATSSWEAALAGRSGARPLTGDWVVKYELPVTFACTLATPATEVLARHEAKKLDPSGQYAMVAAREAWQDAGAPDVEGERLGVAIATGIGGVWTLLSAYDTLKERGARRVLPMTVPMLMPNGSAGAVGIELGAKAGAHTPVSACASGAEAMSYAMDMIRDGRADVVVAGGTEAAIHPLPVAGFAAMQALSRRNDSPETASRPYDLSRDGFVLGEGAGCVVLEAEEHARARGVRIYAELVSAGLTSDAFHIAAPDPSGLGATRAMKQALEAGGLSPDDVVHVNAHATSTPAGDIAESAAIRAALGSAADRIGVSATKSMTGHLLGAAGAVEGIFTILALHHGIAPPTINLTEQDPAVELDVVTSPREIGAGVGLNNSFGFGGHNVAVAFRTMS